MLKLGQDVIIYDTPAYGDEYFDEDYIYERATICGITTINDELAYQLEGYDEDSWWVEDELDDEYEYDQELKTPTYDLGDEVVAELKKTILPTNQIEQVSSKSISPALGRGRRVVLVDLGMKIGIVRELVSRGCDVIVVPYNTTAEEVLRLEPDGVMLTNGPGDPEDAKESIEMIKGIIGKVTIFGICMGHQLVSLACGAKTYKLKFGHRGGNHPVKNILTGRVDITSQNHGYAVDIDSLKDTDLELTHIAINDRSCEGVRHKKYPVFTVQFHPEAAAGPHDTSYLFDEFIKNIDKNMK